MNNATPGPEYVAVSGPFLTRVPLLPIEIAETLATAEDPAQCKEFYDLLSTSIVQMALGLSSPALMGEITDYLSGNKKRLEEQVVSSLTNYLVRASSRCTPFGFWSGVCLGSWHSATKVQWDEPTPIGRVRVDGGAIRRLFALVSTDPGFRLGRRYRVSSWAVSRGRRIFIVPPGAGLEARSLKRTQAIDFVLDLCRHEIGLPKLIDETTKRFPHIEKSRVEATLNSLIDFGLLIPDAFPTLDVDKTFEETIRTFGDIFADEIKGKIHQIGLDLVQVKECLSNPGGPLRLPPSVVLDSIQVDAAWPLVIELPESIAEEAARAATALVKMSRSDHTTLVQSYQSRFLEHFGCDRPVPVCQAVDPHTGIEILDRREATLQRSESNFGDRQRHLQDLALRRGRNHPVILDEADIEILSSGSHLRFWSNSCEINVSVLAADTAALDDGDFQLLVGPGTGAIEAGRQIGRFAFTLNGGFEALQEISRKVGFESQDSLHLEMFSEPLEPRMANVLVRPCQYEGSLYLEPQFGEGRNVVKLRDLFFLHDGHRLRLVRYYEAKLQEVVVHATHVLSPDGLDVLARLLLELSMYDRAQLKAFDWGTARGFPYLPRIVYGRTILSLARWTITPEILRHKTCTECLSSVELWRQDMSVPSTVTLIDGDRRLQVNLETPRGCRELRRVLRKNKIAHIEEVVQNSANCWLRRDGLSYAAELVVPIVLRSDYSPPVYVPINKELPSEADLGNSHLPSTDWTSIHLYCAAYAIDNLIEELVELAKRFPTGCQWFYVRYFDPKPHIRLRFRSMLKSDEQSAKEIGINWAHEMCLQESATFFDLTTFHEETFRYGGQAISEKIFEIFHLDSLCAISINSYTKQASYADALAVRCLSAALFLCALCGSSISSAISALPTPGVQDGKMFRRVNARITKLILKRDLTDETKQILAAIERRDQLIQACQLDPSPSLTRDHSAIIQSLLHMHFNRILGPTRSTEESYLRLCRRTLALLKLMQFS
ncbi:MAG: lantibiotic dehydratase [Armatimonadota bacterium]